MPDTAVHSFVVRFVQEDPALAEWWGFIRHVQTNEETYFKHIQDAIRFMNQFVAVTPDDEEKTNGRSD